MCSMGAMSAAESQFLRNGTSDGVVWSVYKTFSINYLPDLWIPVISLIPNFDNHPWLFSVIGSAVIGLSGVLPLLVIPIEEGANLKSGASARTLRVLLSFAVGCLLGDVFLHLLPEVWMEQEDTVEHVIGHPALNKGLWVLAGLLIFIVLEKVFTSIPGKIDVQKTASDVNVKQENVYVLNNNIKELVNRHENDHHTNLKRSNAHEQKALLNPIKSTTIKVSGYLNLMANSFDNFTHGLAVGGGFLVSFPHGVLTTLAILFHEIPHEVGDFAILLKSGFSRWDAALAQIATASAGIVGAVTAVALSGATSNVESRTSWILPFTAGGFLHIALVTVLPDLLQEENPKESLLHLASLLGGIGIMAALIMVTD
ncbi:zinc transporter ZIP13 homolog [Zootermopsis nevadensis]|uniref:zinc transporter ZIP13 homolog n=1 Tax=Zootermopsis nevadensis TaxID=136037 RepID=UPI000B8ED5C8|nr:zinc transporter ZIP13 homolog [Zootermopsis nevadensis]